MNSIEARERDRQREMYNYEREQEMRQREKERQMHEQREREREARERERREQAQREYEKEREKQREAMERERRAQEEERERERMQQREAREREREQREREQQQQERDQRERERERERERVRERERFAERDQRDRERFGPHAFGRERMEMQGPQTSSSHHPYGMTMTHRYPGGQNGIPPPPSSGPPATSSAMSMPQPLTAGPLGFGPATHSVPPLAAHREYGQQQPFSGYAVSMPPSPFSNSPSLPAVGEDARDRDNRPQRFRPPSREVSLTGRDNEPLRAEDALKQRGLNRPLSGLLSDAKAGKDRDGIVRDKDGIMRLTDSAVVNYHSPPRRNVGLSGINPWGDHLPNPTDKAVLGKRSLEDDEVSTKSEKKKRHHHHHQHGHHLPHYHHHHEEGLLDTPKIGGARAKSPLHGHHHHHAHAHIHHIHPPAANNQMAKVAALLIDSSKVLASLESKPRNYLGSCVYLPTPTPKEGMSVTQPLLPRFEGRENSIFQVRIPKRFLSDAHRKEVARRRCVWGTEVYTDDSDTLGVLMHTGKLPAWLPEDVESPEEFVKSTERKVIKKGVLSASPSAATTASANGKKAGKAKEELPTIPHGKDLLVDLLILPRLERYTGTVRNALKSRSWNAIHDGMSYSIWEMHWVEAGEAESRGGEGKKRRLNEREWVRRWGELPPSRGGMGDKGWAKRRWAEGQKEGVVQGVGA